MREILFRGKRKTDNKWLYGFPYVTRKNAVKINWYCSEFGSMKTDEVIPETVGQYIGQPDKNGKKIFEGDIVKTKYGRICKVVWFAPQCCWDLVPLECKSKVPDQYDLFDSKNLEVIGNIYDNSAEEFNTY